MSIKNRILGIFKYLISVLFPVRCSLCDTWLSLEEEGMICRDCMNIYLKRDLNGPRCCRCGGEIHYLMKGICPSCRQSSPVFTRHQSMGAFINPLDRLIHQIKFGHQRRLCRDIAEMMYFSLGGTIKRDWLVTWVPLSARRVRQRGFNQALEIARFFAHKSGLSLVHCLKRSRHTAPQARLARMQRVINVRDAFEAVNNDIWVRRRVLLIDDVFTTGATVSACTRVLLRSGVLEVRVLTAAHG